MRVSSKLLNGGLWHRLSDSTFLLFLGCYGALIFFVNEYLFCCMSKSGLCVISGSLISPFFKLNDHWRNGERVWPSSPVIISSAGTFLSVGVEDGNWGFSDQLTKNNLTYKSTESMLLEVTCCS